MDLKQNNLNYFISIEIIRKICYGTSLKRITIYWNKNSAPPSLFYHLEIFRTSYTSFLKTRLK